MSTPDGAQVVVLTALPVEYKAVREHLRDLARRSHHRGTQFEIGRLPVSGGRVAIVELGPGNLDAAVAVAHAVEMFEPVAVLFVGVAGALHSDLELGAVVVATQVYAYQGGTETDDGFLARPRAYDADHELLQRARVFAREWPDQVRFRPIAAGDVVLNSRKRPLAKQLRRNYNDAGAIEMESAGMARAGHLHRTPTLTVRSISDWADGAKEVADAGGGQAVAAGNAAGFAVAVLEDYLSVPREQRPVAAGAQVSIQHVVGMGAPAYGSLGGDVHVHEPEKPSAPEWRTESRPPSVIWRTEITGNTWSAERPALELHLVPVTAVARIEVRRLQALAEELAAQRPAEAIVDDRGARAVADGPAGLFVSRDGQRSAWEPLPSDMLGAIFDEEWVTEHLAAALTTLMGLSPPRAVRYAPAVAISPATGLTVDRVARMPRTQASGIFLPATLQVPAEQSLPADHLDHLPEDVAAELAAHLLMALRRGPA